MLTDVCVPSAAAEARAATARQADARFDKALKEMQAKAAGLEQALAAANAATPALPAAAGGGAPAPAPQQPGPSPVEAAAAPTSVAGEAARLQKLAAAAAE